MFQEARGRWKRQASMNIANAIGRLPMHNLVQRFIDSTHIKRMESENYRTALSVMTGLVPVIHVAPFPASQRVSGCWTTWMTGTSPVMTMLPSIVIPTGLRADRCGIKESMV
jgi:hypothetical protein